VALAHDDGRRAVTEVAVTIDISKEAADALCAQLGKITDFVSIHGWPDDD
jgi:hypothetical protein